MEGKNTQPKKSLPARILKWTLIGFGSLLGLFLLAAILIPIFFKDELHAIVKKQINNSLNKEVAELNYSDVSISLFSNFPRVSIVLEDLTIAGKGPFAKDTLVAVDELQAAVSLYNILFEDVPDVKKIKLVNPRIKAVVLSDGRANWDIALPDTAKPEPSDPMKLTLSSVVIKNGDIIYDDHTMPVYTRLKGVQFNTSGDISGDVYDLENELEIEDLYANYDGVTYLKKAKVEAELTVSIDNAKSKYTLKENEIKLNELVLGLDGWVEMPADDIAMDLKFEAKEAEFAHFLSLVPGVYSEDFDDIKTSGSLAFNGFVKGVYNDKRMPGFNVKLNIKDASFQYPDLPGAVTDIQVDTEVNNPDGDLEKTVVDIRRLHANLGGNPIDVKMLIKGITNAYYKGNIAARINLKTLTTLFPIEGLAMKGDLGLNANIEGMASDTTLPKMKVLMDMKYGYLKSADFPSAIENLNFTADISNATGRMSDMVMSLKHFHAEIDQQTLEAEAFVKNLDDPNFKVKLVGTLDLAKLAKIYPMEGTEMSGIVKANVATEGVYSQLSAGNYNMPASGTIEINNLKYKSADLPQGLTISQSKMTVTPAAFELQSYTGTIGKSDLSLTGKLNNYIGYFIKNDLLSGTMTLNSKYLDLNEWMSDEETPTTEAEASTGAEPLPANIAFVFNSNIDKIRYDKMDITNFVGNVELKDQTVYLKENTFKLMGGDFMASGFYAGKTGQNPAFDLNFGIAGLGIQEAYNNLAIVQKYAPVAKQATGKFNTTLGFSGKLTQELDPLYETITGAGFVQLMNAGVKNLPVLQKISAATKLANFDQLNLADSRFDFEIRNGRLHVSPFDIKQGNTTMNIGGSNGIDGSMDYLVKLDMPAGAVGSAASSALSKFAPAAGVAVPDRINAVLKVGGTYDKPTVTPMGGGAGSGSSAKENLKDDLKDKADAKVDELKQEGQKQLDDAKQQLEDKSQQLKDEGQKKIDDAKAEAEKKRLELEQKAKEEAERKKQELKDRFKFRRP